ncbi:vacuolar protein sorting-associated protein 36 [Camellia sinensis]|uniref:vacuolar protein sorting-associated protein 36 n=1 Tax=Camellia sinensis TaxID=4442 RepID=UPI001036C199|nr:vacuolar protein sorting-associated protein 36 [Camellia sinensis]
MAGGKWLPTAELTSSGRPVLHPGEVECSLLSSVDLDCEENPSFPLFKSGLLILTTHRLLWIPDTTGSSSASASASAIPLSAISHIFSTKKSIKSMFASPRVRFQVSSNAQGRVDDKGSRLTVITLVLRGKSDPDSFLAKFWEAWRGRAWESSGPSGSESGKFGPGDVGGSSAGGGLRMPVVGVSGILRKEQEMWESTDKSLQDAFQDLNALMSKAKEMVLLAEKMRQKLLSGTNNQASSANDEEMGSKEEMQDWLLSVGIASPVTKESAGALYHQQLSRQLADFVKIPLERAGGMINLIDIYCLFNRARGTELISPEDLLLACSLWGKFDVPVMLRKFDSGVMVIQNKSHSDEEVFSRIKVLVLKPDALRTGISASDAAITLGIAPAMAKEHLLTAESKGLLCRDVSPDGFRFYINLFQEINLEMVKDHGTYSAWITATFASR